MKKLFVILILIITSSLLGQDKTDAVLDNQQDVWMKRIASDSELRGKMMDMMIMQTKDDKDELMKLATSIFNSPELNKMILAKKSNSPEGETKMDSLEPRGMMKDSVKMKKMDFTKPIYKK